MSTKPSSTSPCVSPCRRKRCCGTPKPSSSASASESAILQRAACSSSSTAAAWCHGTYHTSLSGSRHTAPSSSSCAGERMPSPPACTTHVSTMYAAFGVAPWSPAMRGATHSKE
eukprot:scaffold195666_cov33-Tisochrysis_lutea.AAC.4